jgi:four helix bundle protein
MRVLAAWICVDPQPGADGRVCSHERSDQPSGEPRSGGRSEISNRVLTRAAEGIPGAIVEGCGAATHKEFARYLDISIKSANETEYHLLAAYDHGLISEMEWQKYTQETIEVRKMIYAYRQSILRDEGGPGQR